MYYTIHNMYLYEMNLYMDMDGILNTLFDNYLQYMHRTNTSILIY